MNRLFEIQTLSEKRNLKNGETMDPITIITGGLALLTSMFPSIFGGGRKKLTMEDLNTILPGNGYWTVLLKQYLLKEIPYNTDLETWRLQKRIGYFMWDNRQQICPEIPDSCYPYDNPHLCQACMSKFNEILKKEKSTGGNQPPGQWPGGVGTIDWQTLLLFGGGAFLLFALMNKKKTRKRK